MTDNYLLPSEVARLLHVSPKTITRWANEGKLPYTKTLGGRRKYNEAMIRELAASLQSTLTPKRQGEVSL